MRSGPEQNDYRESAQEAGEQDKVFILTDYTSEDKELLLAVYAELMKTDKGRETIKSRFDWMITTEAFASLLENPDIKYRALVTTPSKNFIGWGEYFIDPVVPERAELSRLVLPDYQGKGVGKTLIGRLIETCNEREQDVTRIESLTRSKNIAAIQSLTSATKPYGGRRIDEPKTDQVRFVVPLPLSNEN